MSSDWGRFAVLFAGAVLLFASVLGVVVTVQHDQQCQVTEVRDSPRGETVEYYYSELTPDRQELFDRMRANPGQRFDSDVCFGGTVRYEDRYHVVEETNVIDWTNPPFLVAMGGLVGGIAVLVSVVRREMNSRPW